MAVVPGYYLVCYNMIIAYPESPMAVVPGYYLVCYNYAALGYKITDSCSSRLLLGML